MEYKCPYCVAVFATKEDVNLHLKVLGTDPQKHIENLNRIQKDARKPGRFMKV